MVYSEASKVTSSWSSSGITWNNQPNCTSTGQASAYRLNGIDYFTVTSIVQSWAPVYTNDYGFRVWDSTAEVSAATNYCDYYSSDYSSSSLRPRMNITYTSSSPTATPTPVPTTIPDENVNLKVAGDGWFRTDFPSWTTKANDALEETDNKLYEYAHIDFLNKSYIEWESPLDLCPFLIQGGTVCFCNDVDHDYGPTIVEDLVADIAIDSTYTLRIGFINDFMHDNFGELEGISKCPEGQSVSTFNSAVVREDFYEANYNLPDVILHEVGHLYGCPECTNPDCIMNVESLYYYAQTYTVSDAHICNSCLAAIIANRTAH